MIREKFNWKPQENESTDAEHRGGMTRSSDELAERPGSKGVILNRGDQGTLAARWHASLFLEY